MVNKKWFASLIVKSKSVRHLNRNRQIPIPLLFLFTIFLLPFTSALLKADAPYQHPFYQKQLQKVQKMKASPLVFLGDSLTHRHNWSNFKASNMGIDGDTTDGVLSRMKLSSQAKTIVLMIGTNDILQGTKMSKIKTNYSKILNTFKTQQKIYILSVLPVIDNKQTQSINHNIRTLNAWLKTEVKHHNMTFLNFYPHFLQAQGLAHPLTTDGIHLTAKGYKLWEKLLKNNIYN